MPCYKHIVRYGTEGTTKHIALRWSARIEDTIFYFYSFGSFLVSIVRGTPANRKLAAILILRRVVACSIMGCAVQNRTPAGAKRARCRPVKISFFSVLLVVCKVGGGYFYLFGDRQNASKRSSHYRSARTYSAETSSIVTASCTSSVSLPQVKWNARSLSPAI